MQWDDIRLLVEVARAGSFSTAAASMGVNVATVSRRAAWLERIAGTQLFRRAPTGTRLTAAGERLLGGALNVEEAVLAFQQQLEAEARQEVAIRMSEGAAQFLFGPVVAGQRLGPLGVAAHKERIRIPPLRLLTPQDAGKADITIVWTPAAKLPDGRPTDRIRKLASITFVPFHSPEFGRAKPAPGKFDDLAEHTLISLKNYSWFQGEGSLDPWHELLGNARREAIVTDWSSTLGHLTMDGAGVGLLPTYSVMYSQRLKPLEVSAPSMVGELWMIASEEGMRVPIVRRCYDAIGRLFASVHW